MRLDLGLVLGVFLELLIMIYYANTTLYPRKNYFRSILITIIGYVFIFIVAIFGNAILNTLITLTVNCLILFLGYQVNISGALFRSVIMAILVFLGETLIMFYLDLH